MIQEVCARFWWIGDGHLPEFADFSRQRNVVVISCYDEMAACQSEIRTRKGFTKIRTIAPNIFVHEGLKLDWNTRGR